MIEQGRRGAAFALEPYLSGLTLPLDGAAEKEVIADRLTSCILNVPSSGVTIPTGETPLAVEETVRHGAIVKLGELGISRIEVVGALFSEAFSGGERELKLASLSSLLKVRPRVGILAAAGLSSLDDSATAKEALYLTYECESSVAIARGIELCRSTNPGKQERGLYFLMNSAPGVAFSIASDMVTFRRSFKPYSSDVFEAALAVAEETKGRSVRNPADYELSQELRDRLQMAIGAMFDPSKEVRQASGNWLMDNDHELAVCTLAAKARMSDSTIKAEGQSGLLLASPELARVFKLPRA